MLLIRNAEIYDPQYLGRRDVLVCGERIECIAEKINVGNVPCKIIDGAGKTLIPGIIDQHVHITGGGGEGGAAGLDGVHQLHQIGAELLGQGLEGGVGVAQGGTGTGSQQNGTQYDGDVHRGGFDHR